MPNYVNGYNRYGSILISSKIQNLSHFVTAYSDTFQKTTSTEKLLVLACRIQNENQKIGLGSERLYDDKIPSVADKHLFYINRFVDDKIIYILQTILAKVYILSKKIVGNKPLTTTSLVDVKKCLVLLLSTTD